METFEEFCHSEGEFSKRWTLNYVCDPTVKEFVPDDSMIEKYKEWTKYKTQDNGGFGFIVYIDKVNNTVNIYGRTNDLVPKGYHDNKRIYNNLIKSYKPLDIFIGTSEFNEMTNFSGGYGTRWDGNSILLRVGQENEFKYVHIGIVVYEFVTDEKITKYVSSVGNNCVPYPYAESLNWVYCMSDRERSPVNDHKDRETSGNISYVDGATYYSMDCIDVCDRGSDNMKYPISNKERTRCVKFKQPTELSLVGNTAQ